MHGDKRIFIAGGIVLFSVLIFSIGTFLGNSKESVSEASSEESIASVYASLSPQAQKLYLKQSENLTKPVPERLVELDQLTIGCFGPQAIMQMPDSDPNLGGQCCGVLTGIEAYELQLQAIQKLVEENGNIGIIPKDPYDVPVEQAKQLISFDSQISLNAMQQQIYDKAIKMSHHGGPCCCKCWKWYLMSGLAKKLIVDYGWNGNQVAEIWDTSSSCGHKEDTNLHQHYETEDNEHEY